MQSLMFLDCFVQRLLKKNLGGVGSTPLPLVKEGLNMSSLEGRLVSYIFYLVNLKLVSRPVWISICKKFCRQKLLNIDKTHDFGFKPLNPPGTKGFGTHTKHQGGVEKDPPSISRTRNATNLKPLEGLGVSFKVSKNFKLV